MYSFDLYKQKTLCQKENNERENIRFKRKK